MTIGERIKQARKAGGYSLRKLADEIGMSAMIISKYERDQIAPGSDVILRLAQALQVDVDFFFRPTTLSVQLKAYRKHATLGVKAQESMRMRIQDWVERYLEVESMFAYDNTDIVLTTQKTETLADVEAAALELRHEWHLGHDPIENLVQLLEDHSIKVGLIDGFDDFDACTFDAAGNSVIVSKAGLPGDRQRFNIGHELGHLFLDIQSNLDAEQAANRFVASFLVPASKARFELGEHRTSLDIHELYLLKHKYGLSMQAWIYRARDLEIITHNTAGRLFQQFRSNGWHRKEPGNPYPGETPMRMERLIYRALAEDLLSRSKAQALLGKPLQYFWEMEALPHHDLAASVDH